ncbi:MULTISPECIES: ABC transporter substrate-binding protein [unclassified Micromonospora]|uniref:ABC transporter substrate-binding protein n=1 Tax=Micromonospora TaxID=1873 RepID=UPI00140AB1D0|nr:MULTISPECIES: ABC transporter substrate-binding protein [unclassified Micromonospora]NHO83782.1 ABC transporter substrate-binding protein [Micromonospora sp. CMU55-4]WBB85535.1 ABC transporter substrate-binding protein [Micromonospora sp. WMMC264]
MRARLATAVGGAMALVVALSACSKNTGDNGDTADTNKPRSGAIATDPKDSLGPAAEVPGAAKGGTFYILRESKISHLDPQRVYSFAGLMGSQLYARFLTTFKDDGKGNVTLVGDLAETPGKNVNNDCKVWEFTIKEGVKFEDGRPITSKEIAYGIARSFDPDLTGGPTYLQEWLADSPQYDTKWDFKKNKTSLPPGLTTPDPRTLRFEFNKPRCDLPFAVSLPATAPLPPDKDTGVNLDNMPFSSGPYRFTKIQPGVEMVLERNTNWDPATDPVRHAYPDKFVWSLGSDNTTQTNRVLAGTGNDAAAVATGGVPPELIAKVTGDPALKARMIVAATPNAYRLSINTTRVTDLSVRQAINYAIDRSSITKNLGGPYGAVPLTTLLPPTTLGYKKYDAYPAGESGDPAKAKETLGGKSVNLVLGTSDDTASQETATQVKNALEKAGFTVTVKPIPEDGYLDFVKKKSNPWDLWVDSWAADWPSGASILPVLFDGRSLKAEGNSNTSQLNNEAINAEFDRVLALDPAKQAEEWSKLDEKLMKESAPAVPLYNEVVSVAHGEKAGGIFIGSIFGWPSFVNAYVKQ